MLCPESAHHPDNLVIGGETPQWYWELLTLWEPKRKTLYIPNDGTKIVSFLLIVVTTTSPPLFGDEETYEEWFQTGRVFPTRGF